MKNICYYLLFILASYCGILWAIIQGIIYLPNDTFKLAIYCGIAGGIGGITYCLRGIYLNACVKKQWDNDWAPWYYIRPIVSFICGIVGFIFLKAGLIILEARQIESPSNYAFYAFAFAAGLNVDKFIEKIEDIAQVTWGIKKSRTATREADISESQESRQ
jgi:hypothetical protein